MKYYTVNYKSETFQAIKYPGRPSMDILVRPWQDLAKISEKP